METIRIRRQVHVTGNFLFKRRRLEDDRWMTVEDDRWMTVVRHRKGISEANFGREVALNFLLPALPSAALLAPISATPLCTGLRSA